MKINSLKNRASPPIFPLQRLIRAGLLYAGSLAMFFSQPNFFSKHGEMMFENPALINHYPQLPNFTLDHQSSPNLKTNINTENFTPRLGGKMFSCLLGTWFNLLVPLFGVHTHIDTQMLIPSPTRASWMQCVRMLSNTGREAPEQACSLRSPSLRGFTMHPSEAAVTPCRFMA